VSGLGRAAASGVLLGRPARSDGSERAGGGLADDSLLMVALPLDDVNSTLHRLLLTEISSPPSCSGSRAHLWLCESGCDLRNIEARRRASPAAS
jgi:hypothetical protein